jgi:hypothetical protein
VAPWALAAKIWETWNGALGTALLRRAIRSAFVGWVVSDMSKSLLVLGVAVCFEQRLLVSVVQKNVKKNQGDIL